MAAMSLITGLPQLGAGGPPLVPSICHFCVATSVLVAFLYPLIQLSDYLPDMTSSLSVASGLILCQISMVNSVAALLNMDVSDDIRADIITAIIKPFSPGDKDCM